MPTKSGSYMLQKGSNQQRVEAVDVYGNFTVVTQPPVAKTIDTGSWSRTWVQTPGYWRGLKRKPLIDLPMNPFTFSNTRCPGVYGEFYDSWDRYPNGTWNAHISEGLYDFPVLEPVMSAAVLSSLDNQAISKALGRTKDQSVNLGVVVGEGKQTLNLIAESAMKLARGVRAVRRGDLAGAAIALGANPKKKRPGSTGVHQSVANNWLALQYGWLPLLSDIHGSCQYLAKTMNSRPRTRVTATVSRVVATKVKSIDYLTNVTDDVSSSYTVKYVIYFTEPLGGTPLTALGLTNPLAVAWELVPFSFVVDWFLPIGNFLNNLDASQGKQFVKGCVTEFWRGRSIRTREGFAVTEGSVIYARKGFLRRQMEKVYCNRRVLSGFPYSSFPEFKSPLSGAHAANALALLAQAFK